MRGQRAIRGGRASVRSARYIAAFNAMRYKDVIRVFADRLSAAGKPFKVVVSVAMRKLLIILTAQLVYVLLPFVCFAEYLWPGSV